MILIILKPYPFNSVNSIKYLGLENWDGTYYLLVLKCTQQRKKRKDGHRQPLGTGSSAVLEGLFRSPFPQQDCLQGCNTNTTRDPAARGIWARPTFKSSEVGFCTGGAPRWQPRTRAARPLGSPLAPGLLHASPTTPSGSRSTGSRIGIGAAALPAEASAGSILGTALCRCSAAPTATYGAVLCSTGRRQSPNSGFALHTATKALWGTTASLGLILFKLFYFFFPPPALHC